MHWFDDSHAHTTQCWWDCDEARWVCFPVAETTEHDDHDGGDHLYGR